MEFHLLGPSLEGGIEQDEKSEEGSEEQFLLSCPGQMTIQLVTAAEANTKKEVVVAQCSNCAV